MIVTNADGARAWLAGTASTPRKLADAIDAALAAVDLAGRDPLFCRFATAALIRQHVQAQGLDPDDPDLPQRASDAAEKALAETIPGRLGEILDMADAQTAAAAADDARIRADERTRKQVTAAADEILHRLEAAEAMRRGALLDLGALTRTVQKIRDERGDIGVDVSWLAHRTVLSRPTLYKYAEQVDTDSTTGKLSRMSTAEIARLHLGYEFADEAVAGEFHARLPHLGGWYAAAQHLQHKHAEAYWDARGGFDPMATTGDGPGRAPGALMTAYRQAVKAIADDQPYEMEPGNTE